MSKRVGELCLGRKKNLKRPSSVDAIDTPPGKLRNTTGTNGTTRKDTQRARGFHNLVIDTEDTTKLASSLIYARKEDSVTPIDDQKGTFPTVPPNFRQSSLAQQKRGLRASRSLCKRCKKIDLDELLSTKYKTSGGLPAGGLTNVSTWEVDTCALCNLLRSTLPPSVPDDSEQLPTKLPRTIEDAITVTQKLDFRYLWVDRYCINQQPDEEQGVKEKHIKLEKWT
jgi:hypothetical protein